MINGVFDWKDVLIFNLIQLLANALVWGVLAPLGDVVIYQEAAEKYLHKGLLRELQMVYLWLLQELFSCLPMQELKLVQEV